MNLSTTDDKFRVYMHTSPNGKRYIGITCRPLAQRWGKDGKGYKENHHFWNAIQKYGWDNFKHEIVASELSLDDACTKEKELIRMYNATDPNFGYNHTDGGQAGIPNEEVRKRLSRAVKRSRQDPAVMAKISAGLKGHPVSDITREKISKANKGRKRSEAFCQKQRARRHTPETIAKLKAHSSLCKGLTMETDERLRKMADARRGVPMSDAAKVHLSITRKQQYADGYDPMWINNGEVETTIQRGSTLPEGYTIGRLNSKNIYIHLGESSTIVSASELASYLLAGWVVGRPASVGLAIKKGAQRMHWEYEGMRFECAEALASYLRDHGYPKIVSSTITALAIKGFDKSRTYSSLHGKVVRVDHEDKIHSEN